MTRQAPAIRRISACLATACVLVALTASRARAVLPTEHMVCQNCHLLHNPASYPFLLGQLCEGCHVEGGPATAVQTHSSRYLGNGYGDWEVDCWGCHDPHKDIQDQTYGTSYGKLLKVDLNAVIKEIDPAELGPYWWPISELRTVAGTAIRHTSNTEFVDGDGASDDDICQACHVSTSAYNTGAQLNTHSDYGPVSQPGGECTSCHGHASGFAPAGSDCVGCHKNSEGGRRIITENVGGDGEFGSGFTSHHVNDGSTTQIVTKWDCVVCHAEGNAETGDPDPAYHKKDGVQLKNVDGVTVNTDVNGAYDDWPTLTAEVRSEFCLSCHDGDGATNITTRTSPDPDATVNALNPFNDGLTNRHEPEGFDTPPTPAPHVRPRVVDVRAQFNTTNTSHHAVLGAAYSTAAPFTSSGVNVNDAIQGVRTDLAWNSILNCEDCHYGTATTKLNGHGTANARYMLRDMNGNDTAAAGVTVVCYRCHNPSDANSIFPEHDKVQHLDDTLNLYGIACLNCHGGGGYGGIHGSTDPVTDDNSGGSYNPNVFTFGAGLDLITNWTSWAKNGVTCSAKADPSLLNGCTQHGSQRYQRLGVDKDRTYRKP